jgi:hypothetical protein
LRFCTIVLGRRDHRGELGQSLLHLRGLGDLVYRFVSPAAVGFSGAQGQDEVFARHAAAHDVKLPERSYLRAALAQRRAEIIARFAGTVAFSP